MKHLLFIFFILLGSSNGSCASFPLHVTQTTDTLQTKEIKQYHYSLQKLGGDLSSCMCISCSNGIDPIVVKVDPLPINLEDVIEEKKKKKMNSSGYVLLSILSTLSAFFLGLLSVANAMSHNGSDSAVLVFFVLSIISIIGAFILAGKARRNGAKLSTTILAMGIAILATIFLFPLFFV